MKIIKSVRLNNGKPKIRREKPYWNQNLLKGECTLRKACKDAIMAEEWRNKFDYHGIVFADNIAQIGDMLVVPTKSEDGHVFYVETQDVVEDVDENVHKFYCEGKLIAVMCHDKWQFDFNGEKSYEELKQMVDYDLWVEGTAKEADAIIAQEVELFATNVKNKLRALGDVSCFDLDEDCDGATYFEFTINGTKFIRNIRP
jgi:hypothetical protein